MPHRDLAALFSRRTFAGAAMLVPGTLPGRSGEDSGGSLAAQFREPPESSRPWVYWWWLDGAASRAGITADLEEFKRRGICGVLLFDCGFGGPEAPKGHVFLSEPWRVNFRHAVREAARLGIEMGVNLCSGWNAGGPWVTPEHAVKVLTWSEIRAEGLRKFERVLPHPEYREGWYRDIAVLACREEQGGKWSSAETVDLTGAVSSGSIGWNVPAGSWTILRIGCTLSGKRTSLISSPAGSGYEIDPLNAAAMDLHFAATASKLIADAGTLTGKTFKYTHIDSWEIGRADWTANYLAEFRRRRGYDALKHLPALARKIVDSHEATERFLWDYRRTTADLIAQNYYGRLAVLSKKHGLGVHAESGGPFFGHNVDGIECEGLNDIPMGEFWLENHQYNSLRQAASAAHVHGKPLVQAEAFTSDSDDYSDDPFALKKQGDRAFCSGLTRAVLHHFVQQPLMDAKPGFHWVHIGTSFDRNVTWWSKSGAWLTYLTRCQHILRQGKFAAEILYFSGEAIPNFVLFEQKVPAGHNFDVINAQALLARASAQNGRVTLPDGLSYRYLAIIDRKLGTSSSPMPQSMSVSVMRKLRELVEAGVTLVGPRPLHPPGLTGYPASDAELRVVADALWGTEAAGERKVGLGRVIWGQPVEAVIQADHLAPQVDFRGAGEFDWIERRTPDGAVYFVSNQSTRPADTEARFRCEGVAELWDPVTGEIRPLPEFQRESGCTAIPLRFEPLQSFFVVFRRGAGRAPEGRNFPTFTPLATVEGPWILSFDPAWGGPAETRFDQLEDWTVRAEEGIRYYSGAARYRKTFDLPAWSGKRLFLDLGTVRNVAEVRLNGRNLGVFWCPPWRVDISAAVRSGANELEIEVVNLWRNRLIGDGLLPKERRRTVTNVRTYDPVLPDWLNLRGCKVCTERKKTGAPARLLPSGLLGPVRLLVDS